MGVLGLGLIGGSLARDLQVRGVAVAGWDADAEALESATREGVIAPMGSELRELGGVDLVVLAMPVTAARVALPEIARRADRAVITDVGSTKRTILEAAAAVGVADRFVGSHPLTGDERSGWSSSRVDLFRGARVYIVPGANAREGAVEAVTELWTAIGGDPARIAAAEHDRLMAWMSHAPQVVSTALGAALDGAGVRRADLGPGGRDATRLAGSSPDVWTEILAENSDEVVRALDSVIERLEGVAAAMRRSDVAALRSTLAKAREWSAGGP